MSGGQKASDYVLEPCVAMPEITAAPDQRDWGQAVDGIGVLSEEGKWKARAADARKAAAALDDCLARISPILKVSYLGEGCSEGAALRTRVLETLGDTSGWSNALKVQIQQLEALAEKCENAAIQISATDQSSMTQFPGTAS
ncbi:MULTISPECIES: hypothetical protein [Gordonia]|uniref:Uncharacterized protein n=1 Tax=Gordonia tangerina TaxID=2911060 RepID=A0ABS9DEP8_9ACTN|nr:hypothetical protein [Gordonia tangerina]MCF3937685.1 hypothetical protein [Gordonia tangerina]